MLLPLDDYQDQLPHVMENDILKAGLDYAREYYGTEDGELSILPFGVGKNTLYAAADTDRYAIKLNYQLYEQIGAPEFEKLEDVIPILKEMQQAYPQNEEGMNVYAMNLFSDFDTTHFFNMMSIYSILGYHWNYLPYGIEYEIETGTPYSIFREDSVYRRGARFMYELVPFPVSWTVKMKKKQKETQDILSYHTQAAGCSDKARAKASGGRQPIEECGRTGL